MIALITGASSGMGRDMARILDKKGYDLILVARRLDKLEELKKELQNTVTLYSFDLSKIENCYKLYENVKDENINIVINNAGFGLFGEFISTDLERELNMVDLNIKSLHVLTKLFLKDFVKKDSGYLFNVASSAAFEPGPLMATYYATKAYVFHLTEAIYEELRHKKSHVYVGCFCPGPVNTEFNQVANVKFGLKGLDSNKASSYAIKKMFQRKRIVVPGIIMKINLWFNRFLPRKLLLRGTYYFQSKKDK